MSQLTNQQIDAIARRIVSQLSAAPRIKPESPVSKFHFMSEGIFSNINSAVEAVNAAQREFIRLPLSKRDEIIASIRKSMIESARTLAEMANSETGLGRVEDKVKKNILVTEKTPGTEDLYPMARSGDRGLSLFELAPFGAIGAITPVTNPTSTIICNTIGMLAAGNGVVFNVHPIAKNVSMHNISLLSRAVVSAGGPPNLIATIAEPTIESAQELMKHPGIRLLVVTGGPAVVKAAMQSGKRAICAGPGNPPAVVDETADISKAGRDIVLGASFDNNVICTDEKTTFVVDKVAIELLRSMANNGAVVLNRSQSMRLERVIFEKTFGPGKEAIVNKALIGRNASVILSKIGMNVDDKIRLAVMEVDKDHPLVITEQMMPVMPVVKVKSADEGIDLAKWSERGCRHTASMHSRNIDNLSRMAREMDCSIFVKNGPNYAGLGQGGEGYCSFSIASPTGEGLTRPRSFSRERRCVLVDHFRIV
ncbi:MAG: aldehyde dehydrogenase EutE [candidate division Zixibacteria bacterium CG_4_9_14_3_um_filter_46_8]|nr:MAG: aldehyde dehydrogenase EutE [candidate division Zixibacteria bacterium CG_4_9_14_3_um_filter_46_8]